MRALRLVALLLALSLMLGEAYRSWGVGRPIYAWLDDQIMGAFLLLGAWLAKVPSPRNRAIFSAAWAFNAGMLYPSFFQKVFEPQTAQPGNFPLPILTLLIGIAFSIACFGTLLSFSKIGENDAR